MLSSTRKHAAYFLFLLLVGLCVCDNSWATRTKIESTDELVSRNILVPANGVFQLAGYGQHLLENGHWHEFDGSIEIQLSITDVLVIESWSSAFDVVNSIFQQHQQHLANEQQAFMHAHFQHQQQFSHQPPPLMHTQLLQQPFLQPPQMMGWHPELGMQGVPFMVAPPLENIHHPGGHLPPFMMVPQPPVAMVSPFIHGPDPHQFNEGQDVIITEINSDDEEDKSAPPQPLPEPPPPTENLSTDGETLNTAPTDSNPTDDKTEHSEAKKETDKTEAVKEKSLSPEPEPEPEPNNDNAELTPDSSEEKPVNDDKKDEPPSSGATNSDHVNNESVNNGPDDKKTEDINSEKDKSHSPEPEVDNTPVTPENSQDKPTTEEKKEESLSSGAMDSGHVNNESKKKKTRKPKTKKEKKASSQSNNSKEKPLTEEPIPEPNIDVTSQNNDKDDNDPLNNTPSNSTPPPDETDNAQPESVTSDPDKKDTVTTSQEENKESVEPVPDQAPPQPQPDAISEQHDDSVSTTSTTSQNTVSSNTAPPKQTKPKKRNTRNQQQAQTCKNALTAGVAGAQNCGDSTPGWFRKLLNKARDTGKKAVEKVSGLFSRSKKKALPKGLAQKIKQSSSSQVVSQASTRTGYSATRTVLKVLITTVVVVGGGYLTWRWVSSGKEESSEKSKLDETDMPEQPEQPSEKESLPAQKCNQKGFRKEFIEVCEDLVKQGADKAAQLVARSARTFDFRLPLPIFSVFQRDGDQSLFQNELPVEKEGLVYGAAGFYQDRVRNRSLPAYSIDQTFISELFSEMAQLIARELNDEDIRQANEKGLDPFAQALFWCGIPLGNPAKDFHSRCTDGVIAQITEDPTWYLRHVHRVYYLQQTSLGTYAKTAEEISDRGSYLGLSPVYSLDAITQVLLMEYEPRELKADNERAITISTPLNQSAISGSKKVTPADITQNYDLLILEENDLWSRVQSNVEKSQPLALTAGRIYGIAHPGHTLPYHYLATNGQQAIELSRKSLSTTPKAGKKRSRHDHSWLYIRQSGLEMQALPKTPPGNILTNYPLMTLGGFMVVFNVGFQLAFPESRTNSFIRQAVDGFMVTTASVVLWGMLRERFEPHPLSETPLPERYQKLSSLLKHFQEFGEYDKARMLLALAVNAGAPLGTLSFSEEREAAIYAKKYTPLTSQPFKQQIKLFSKSYSACKKQFKNCTSDQREHIEYLRFHMMVCEGMSFNHSDCVTFWSDRPTRRAWLGAMTSIDWQEETLNFSHTLDYKSFSITPTFSVRKGAQFFMGFGSEPGFWVGSDRLFEVDGRYRCQPSSYREGVANDEAVRCHIHNQKTLVEFKNDAVLILIPELHQRWEQTRWLVFRGGNLLEPVWKRQSQWQKQSVQRREGTLDSYLQVLGSEEPDTKGRNKTPLAGADAEFCNSIAFENLRLACLSYPLDSASRKYISQLQQYGSNTPWVAEFNWHESHEGEPAHLIVVDRIPFSSLSVERLLWHLALIREFPELGQQQETIEDLMAFVGSISRLQGLVDQEAYRRMYKNFTDNSKAHIIKASPDAQCYKARLQQSHWCSAEAHCLLEVPNWTLGKGVTHYSSEIRLVRRNKVVKISSGQPASAGLRIQLNQNLTDSSISMARKIDWGLVQRVSPLVRVETLKDTFDINVEDTPFYVTNKNSNEIRAIFMLHHGKLYQGACDAGLIKTVTH